MASLVWLLIPLTAGISAVVWASWAARQIADGSSGDAAGVAGYDAFRTAMERSQDRTGRGLARMATDGPSRAAD
ncbi:hypothetical protein QNO07_25445 [Streptomyces sp. 549]|uniref:hypothetical protein n=1 Tax=Streptomyces sp. 549 TaxID=3049076 RepID=UPI0024C3E923|nr:hypothetical protein [Streptomyces sp. 549]MDK1476708.1 hypothetical protein [Streptomyces sp. 549]